MGLFDTTTRGLETSAQNTTATQTATPYKPAVKGLNTLTGSINSFLQQPVLGADAQQGIGMIRSLAGQGTPGLDQANSYISSLYGLAQQPVDMNPYASQVADQASQRAVAGALSQASMAGRYGSNAATSGAVDASINAQMPYLSQEWNAAQARKQAAQGLALQGAAMLPTLDALRYTAPTALLQAGLLPNQLEQDRIKTSAGGLGVIGQMGGTKTTSGATANYGTKTGTQDNSDVAGWAGLIGKFW